MSNYSLSSSVVDTENKYFDFTQKVLQERQNLVNNYTNKAKELIETKHYLNKTQSKLNDSSILFEHQLIGRSSEANELCFKLLHTEFKLKQTEQSLEDLKNANQNLEQILKTKYQQEFQSKIENINQKLTQQKEYLESQFLIEKNDLIEKNSREMLSNLETIKLNLTNEHNNFIEESNKIINEYKDKLEKLKISSENMLKTKNEEFDKLMDEIKILKQDKDNLETQFNEKCFENENLKTQINELTKTNQQQNSQQTEQLNESISASNSVDNDRRHLKRKSDQIGQEDESDSDYNIDIDESGLVDKSTSTNDSNINEEQQNGLDLNNNSNVISFQIDSNEFNKLSMNKKMIFIVKNYFQLTNKSNLYFRFNSKSSTQKFYGRCRNLKKKCSARAYGIVDLDENKVTIRLNDTNCEHNASDIIKFKKSYNIE